MRYRMIVFLTLTGLASNACGDDSVTEPPQPQIDTATLRVVHASPDVPSLRIQIAGEQLGFTLSFGQATAYSTVQAAATLEARHAIAGTSLFSAPFDLVPDSVYTLLLSGLPSSAALSVAADTGATPAPGTVKIRVIHAAPVASAIEVFLTQPGVEEPFRLLFPFSFETISHYQQGDPGDYEVVIVLAGDLPETPIASSGTIALTADQVRTVVVMDGPGGGVQLAILDDTR